MNSSATSAADFSAHNAEVRQVWEAYRAGRPTRVPMVVGTNPRYLICERGANSLGIDFRSYSEDPDTMFHAQLRFQHWVRHHIPQDAEMGLPQQWGVYVDFQNYYEAAWFGSRVEYRDGQVPYASPVYADRPEDVMERGIPDPFGGIMGRSLEYHERMKELAAIEEFMGRPVVAQTPGTGLGTDGPLTVACCLFTAQVVCEMMGPEPERLRRLLDFITKATVHRIAAWKMRFGISFPHDSYGFADDSIALISVRAYRDHVLPHHRKLFDTFGTAKGRSIHLCGDATRHFRTNHDELGVVSFDTGYPVDFGQLRRTLGPEVEILGGPSAPFLVEVTPEGVRAETLRILHSGITEGGRFILREGNNLAPATPVANIAAMYETVREAGCYDEGGKLCIR